MKQSPLPSQESRLNVIAAIPCFNTKRFIEDVVSRTKKYVGQVIAIDDGSSDGTAEAARAAGALVINHSVNRGYGEAIKSCFGAAKVNTADILITIDGDGQHNPDEIPRLLAPILQGEADLVIGSRFLGDQGNMPRYRRFGIRVITFLFNVGSKTKVSDAQSGFRAYSKRALITVSSTEAGMSVSVETLIKARAAGLRIKEVATSCQYHPYSSSLNPISHGLGVAFSVVKLRLKNMTGRLSVGRQG